MFMTSVLSHALATKPGALPLIFLQPWRSRCSNAGLFSRPRSSRVPEDSEGGWGVGCGCGYAGVGVAVDVDGYCVSNVVLVTGLEGGVGVSGGRYQP